MMCEGFLKDVFNENRAIYARELNSWEKSTGYFFGKNFF